MTNHHEIDHLRSGSALSVIAATLLAGTFFVAFLASVRAGAPVSTIVPFAIGAVVMIWVLLSTIGNRIVLFDDYLESRDWLFRLQRVPYAQVEGIDFRRGTALTIRMTGRKDMRWAAKTPKIESFIEALSERVTRFRPLQISGDLEIDQRGDPL